MVEEAVQTKIDLTPLDQALLSRYFTEWTYATSLGDRFKADAEVIEAEISQEQQRLSFLQGRLSVLQQDLIGAGTKAQEAENLLRSIKAQILGRGDNPDDESSYELEVTPNGTVTSLIRKE